MSATGKLARYREISRLGSGAMASVVLAEDTNLGRLVALKRVHALGAARGSSRVRREALLGASVSHPNLVAVYDVVLGEDDEQVIVMEYVEGQTLRDALEGGSGLAVPDAVRVIDGVAAGLDAIHRRGIVHRDVKPANILLGTGGEVKLADLGIASAVDRTRITTDGAVLGTMSYMAPEQLDGARPGAAVDIYALAAVAFEALSGRQARLERNPVALAHALATQPPPDLSAVWPAAPPAAVELLAEALSRDVGRRPHSAGELAARLHAALAPPATTPVLGASRHPTLPGAANARETARDRHAPSRAAMPRGRGTRDDLPAGDARRAQRPQRRDVAPGARSDHTRPARPAPAAASASSAGRSDAPDLPASRVAPSERGPDTGIARPASAPLAPVSRHRSRARMIAGGSIALVAAALAIALTLNGPGAKPSASSTRVASSPSPRSHTTKTARTPRTRASTSGAATTPSVPSSALTAPTSSGRGLAPARSAAPSTGSLAAERTTTSTAGRPPAGTSTRAGGTSTTAAGTSTTAAGTSTRPAGTSTTPAGTSTTPAGRPATPAPGDPVSAVESFYTLAAAHRYPEAWALADPAFRAQLGGYASFQAGQADDRSITFDSARIVQQTSANATVAVQTTSVHSHGTQHCAGTVELVPGGAASGWLVHLIHINCT